VNADIQAGDWVFVDGHARMTNELGTRAAGTRNVPSRGEDIFSLDIGGYPETLSRDPVTAATDPLGDPRKLIHKHVGPQDAVVPGNNQHTGEATARKRTPRDGRSVRPPQGAPAYAPRGPTGRGSGDGRRLPSLRGIPLGGGRGSQVSNRAGFLANATCFIGGHVEEVGHRGRGREGWV